MMPLLRLGVTLTELCCQFNWKDEQLDEARKSLEQLVATGILEEVS